MTNHHSEAHEALPPAVWRLTSDLNSQRPAFLQYSDAGSRRTSGNGGKATVAYAVAGMDSGR